jgi:hypothetical protein
LAQQPEARHGLAKLRAGAVELASLLAKHAAKLLLRAEALLGSLAHLLGQALLCCKLLPCRGLQELAVALAGCKALLSSCACHACKLLLGAKALGCGLAKLGGKALLCCKALLRFRTELPCKGLLGPELLRASCPKAPGLGRFGS